MHHYHGNTLGLLPTQTPKPLGSMQSHDQEGEQKGPMCYHRPSCHTLSSPASDRSLQGSSRQEDESVNAVTICVIP